MKKPLKQCESKVVDGVIYTGGEVPPDTVTKKDEPKKEKGGKDGSETR